MSFLHRADSRLSRSELGQSSTEYVVLIVLVVIASVVGWTILKAQLSKRVRGTAETIVEVDSGLPQERPVLPELAPGGWRTEAEGDSRPDHTVPLSEPSIVERLLSNPETTLVWLFVIFLLIVAAFRFVARQIRKKEEEEETRREEVYNRMRRVPVSKATRGKEPKPSQDRESDSRSREEDVSES